MLGRFLQCFRPHLRSEWRHDKEEEPKLVHKPQQHEEKAACWLQIINISSLCAIEPFLGFNLYCSGKAAREMHMKVMAKEYEGDDKLLMLNYSPGPMQTHMMEQILTSPTAHPDILNAFQQLKEKVSDKAC